MGIHIADNHRVHTEARWFGFITGFDSQSNPRSGYFVRPTRTRRLQVRRWRITMPCTRRTASRVCEWKTNSPSPVTAPVRTAQRAGMVAATIPQRVSRGGAELAEGETPLPYSACCALSGSA